MTMKEIYADYREYEGKYREKVSRLEKLIDRHQSSLKRLKHKHEGWIKRLLIPLADEISQKMGGMPYEIYGPYGLAAHVTIYLFPTGMKDVTKDETYTLGVEPYFRDGVDSFSLKYDTGKSTNEYAKGSIGYLNGFNQIYEELPDSIEEIIGLLRHHPAKED